MTTPFDTLTAAVNNLIVSHKTLQENHSVLQSELATRDQQAQDLVGIITSLTPACPPAETPAEPPAQPYGRHAGDKG